MMKVMRRGMFIVIAAVLVVSGGIYFVMTADRRRLGHIGYNDEEIEVITAQLERHELPPIFENEYLPELREILTGYAEPADFRSEKLTDYIEVQQKYGFLPEKTLALVNHVDYDATMEYTERRLDILYDEYYVKRNLERYFAMDADADDGRSLSAAEIVALVNANRDHDYYTNTEPARRENDELLLVNKYFYLDREYTVELVEQDASYGSVGEKMETETYAAFKKMFQAAQADGYQLYVTSGYRGYDEQDEVYASYLAEGGEEHALKYAAKPGYSEHQTGRALDIFTPGATTQSFADSPVAAWLAAHAHEYGFILRYPKGKENLTGYNYEPWHYRYVGQAAAAEIRRRELTLEEYVAVFGK